MINSLKFNIMKKILLPTDFSDNSWNAIKYAIQLFENEECVFNILNTYMPVVYDVDYSLGYANQFDMGEMIRDISIRKLNEFMDKISETFKENPKHQFKTLSQFDTLVSGIENFLSENETYLIVMGTKGATGAKEVLFGSNTVHTFKKVNRPILAIPSGFEYEKPVNILFPSDLEVDYNNFYLDVLKQIAIDHKSKVNVLYVSTGDSLTENKNRKKSELQSQFKDSVFSFHQIESKSVTAGID